MKILRVVPKVWFMLNDCVKVSLSLTSNKVYIPGEFIQVAKFKKFSLRDNDRKITCEIIDYKPIASGYGDDDYIQLTLKRCQSEVN